MSEASQTQRQDKRRNLMLDTPIPKLIPKMAVPTIVAMLITSVYSMADTYFVSFLGTSATAAVGVNFSIDNIIMMAGSFLAMGANSYIARLLGAQKTERATQVLSTAFFTALFTGACVGLLGFTFMKPILRLVGATETVLPYAIDYASYVLLAAPFMASNFVMNQCLRSEGSATYSMIGMGFGGILNMFLDPLFIFVFDWGIAGAAAATALSKLVSFSILIFPYVSRRSLLRLSIKQIRYTREIVSEILRMGSPALLRTGLNIIANILMNNMAGAFSDSALAAISVCNRVMMLPTSAILGFGQGFQPVAGFNWGARRYDRVWKAFWFCSWAGVAVITVLSVLMGVFSQEILLLFSKQDAVMIEIGRLCLLAQCVVMPIHAWVIVVNMLHAGIGKAVGTLVLSVSRQGLCFIPMVLILPRLFGIQGLALTQAAADLLSLALAVPFAFFTLRELRQRMNAMEGDGAEAAALEG